MADDRIEDGIQHGIDDDPNNDAKKGATLGGIGGAAVGAAAGSMLGPVGAVVGGAIGAAAGAIGSGIAVGAVDRIDNDNNVSGVGDGVTYENDSDLDDDDTYTDTSYATTGATAGTTHRSMSGTTAHDLNATYGGGGVLPGNDVPGIQTGGRAIDGTPDTRGISEKAADTLTGDKYDDKTGRRVDY